MKISFCTIAYRNEHVPVTEIIHRIKGLGYDAVEIWGKHLLGNDTLYEIKEALALAELDVSIISPYFNFTGTTQAWKRSFHHAVQMLEWASDLNAKAIRCFTGSLGSGGANYAQWRDCVIALRALCDMADKKGISLLVETHPDTLADTHEAISALLRAVDRENIGLIFDFFNVYEVEPTGMTRALEALFPHIRHLHLKNASLNGKPSPFGLVHRKGTDLSSVSYLKNGDIDYRSVLDYLIERRFDGDLSVEWFGYDVDAAASHEANYLRAMLRTSDVAQNA